MASSIKAYFASDFHLGLDSKSQTSVERESIICDWLDHITPDATHLFLLGDIFDYWFEYKGEPAITCDRLFEKFKALKNKGVIIEFFTGNHDMWMKDFFPKKFNIPIHYKPLIIELDGKSFFLGHGDGIGKGDYLYKCIKVIFSNRFNQWLFSLLPPSIGLSIMKNISKSNREHHHPRPDDFKNDRLLNFCKEFRSDIKVDYFILGHRHIPMHFIMTDTKREYYNLGDWIHHRSYVSYDGDTLRYEFYKNEKAVLLKNH